MSLARFVPRNEQFFTLFQEEARNVVAAAQSLLDLLEHFVEVERKVRRLRDLEQRGDELTHHLFAALNRTFVTPLDREDISHLASALDDVIDWIEETSRYIRLAKIDSPTPLARRFGKVILEQCEQIARAVPLLEDRRSAETLQRATQEIHRLENEADDLLAEGIAGIYDGVTEVPQLIRAMRLNDLYQLLEDATDKVEQAAVAVQNIAMKNA